MKLAIMGKRSSRRLVSSASLGFVMFLATMGAESQAAAVAGSSVAKPPSAQPAPSTLAPKPVPPKRVVVPIGALDRDPRYLVTRVTIEGVVKQWAEPKPGVSKGYLLADNYGAWLTVRTTREPLPKLGDSFFVTGIVRKDEETGDIFLLEEVREPINAPAPPTTGTAPAETGSQKVIDALKDPYLLALIGIGFIFIVVLVLVFRLLGGRREDEGYPVGYAPPPGAMLPDGSMQAALPGSDYIAVSGKTVKMFAPSAAAGTTIKLLPGKLEVIAGETDSRAGTIRFYRPQGGEPEGGYRFSFGRGQGTPLQHVQLDSQTVSRKQATVRYQQSKHYLLNQASAESNPTIVNDRPLSVDEEVLLEDGDRIEMGEIIMVYHEK
jgi:hypothetical protein